MINWTDTNKLIDKIWRLLENTELSNNESEDELEEISTSAGAGAYSTPNAFSSDTSDDGSQKLTRDPQYTFSQKPNTEKRNTINMKESKYNVGDLLQHTNSKAILKIQSIQQKTVKLQVVTPGTLPGAKVGKVITTGLNNIQHPKLYTKINVVDESIAFHDKHPDLAKKYGIVGPFADPKKASEMGKQQNKLVYTADGKRHYLVDPKLEKDLEQAGFKKVN